MVETKVVTVLFVFLVLSLMFNGGFVSAIRGSMGNARMILYPEVNGWTNTVIEKTILTRNVNEIPINITLKLTEESKEFIELIDESYILQPGEEKKAQFEVKVKKEGTYEGRILVFFSAEDENETSPGVVLSSQVVVIAKKHHDYQEFVEDKENEDVDPITSAVIGSGSKTGLILMLSITALLLVVVLGFLVVAKDKSKKNSKRKKK